MKYLFCLFSFLMFFNSCGNESSAADQEEATEVTSEENGETGLEYLKKNAIAENDYYARVEHSLVPLQDAYRMSEGKVPGVGKVTVFVDTKYNLLIKNEVDGDTYETKVNLTHLNPNNGGMELIPDRVEGEYPGVRLNVLSGREGVEIWKNGELESEERALEIYLPDRPSIEKITPSLAQALNIVHKKVQ